MTQLHSFHDPSRVVPIKDADVSAVRPHETGQGSVVHFRNGAITTVTELTSQIQIDGLVAFQSQRPDDPLTLIRPGHVSFAETYGQARTKVTLRGGHHLIVSERVEKVRDVMAGGRAS